MLPPGGYSLLTSNITDYVSYFLFLFFVFLNERHHRVCPLLCWPSFGQHYVWGSFMVEFVLHFPSWFVFICKGPHIAKVILEEEQSWRNRVMGYQDLSWCRGHYDSGVLVLRTDRWTSGAEESPEIGPHIDSGLTDRRGAYSVLREGRHQKR